MKRFLCGLAVLGALGVLLFWGAAAEADLTIMPLGDSITYGNGVPGGYRTRLYTDLHSAGFSFTFVGTVTANPSAPLSQAGQTHVRAHSGKWVCARTLSMTLLTHGRITQ